MSFCKINNCSRQVTFPAEVESGFCVEHLHIHIGDLKTCAEVASNSRDFNAKKLRALQALVRAFVEADETFDAMNVGEPGFKDAGARLCEARAEMTKAVSP